MKTLIIYYSLTGTNDTLCRKLQKELKGAVMERIAEKKPKKGLGRFIRGGFGAIFEKLNKLEDIKNDLLLYDLVILGTPFWVGTLPPATRTFLTKNKDKIKKLAVISVSAMGEANKKAIPELESVLGKTISAKLMLDLKEFKNRTYNNKFVSFLKEINQV